MARHIIGSYQTPKFKPSLSWVMNALYYDSVEEAQKCWQEYVFEDGHIYAPINQNTVHNASRYLPNNKRLVHRNLRQIESHCRNRKFICLDCGAEILEGVNHPVSEYYASSASDVMCNTPFDKE